MDISKTKHIHFVGIKGVAMTALALLVKEKGIMVTGSDVEDKFPTDETLKKHGITPLVDFNKSHIDDSIDLVIYTGAHNGSQNVEVITAQKQNIPVLPHGKALGIFCEGKKTIAVAGSHGKTTTSALIATVLKMQNYDPSFAIGCGDIFALGASGGYGKGDYSVVEADEYMTDPQTDKTPRFLHLNPFALLITNIEFDHPDAFSTLSEIEDAFHTFVQKIQPGGFLTACIADPAVKRLISRYEGKVVTYGKDENADFFPTKIVFSAGETKFSIRSKDTLYDGFTLKVPGMHNVLNATGALALLITLEIPISKIKKGIAQFSGTKRRFELVKKENDVWYFDDYAHHPTEIAATLTAARVWFAKNRIIAIFQPHTYSRTVQLLSEFSSAFSNADTVVITDIYPSAREKPMPGVTGEVLSNEIRKNQKDVYYAKEKTDVLDYLKGALRPNDVVITMGAGDIYQILEQDLHVIVSIGEAISS